MFLSSKGFSNLFGISFDDDFVFDNGVNKYGCPRITAAFFSPAVARKLKEDPLFDCFFVDDIDDQFSVIYDMMHGNPVKVESSSADVLLGIAKQLENAELSAIISKESDGAKLEVFSVIERTKRRSFLGLSLENEFAFIFGHISDIKHEDVARLGVQTVLDFFMSVNSAEIPKFVFSVVIDCIGLYGAEAAQLFTFINFRDIDREEAVSFLDKCLPEMVTPELWRNISLGLVDNCPEPPEFSPEESSQKQVIEQLAWAPNAEPLDFGENAFGGLFSEMRKTAGGNPAKNGFVRVSFSGSTREDLQRLLDPDNSSYYLSPATNMTDDGPAIIIDFINRQVSVNAYTLKTIDFPEGNYHIKSWIVETSNDYVTWTVIDRHHQCQVMNSKNKVATFATKRGNPSRYVRIRMTSENFWGTKQLCLMAIELFGQFANSHV